MTLQGVVSELFQAFPELKPLADREFDYYGDQPLDPYPVFAVVLRPVVFAALDRGDSQFLDRAFGFYEEALDDGRQEMMDLVGCELIEQLANEAKRLQAAWRYMGPATKDLARVYARESRRQFGKDVPLPE